MADVEDKIICLLDNFKIGELFVAYHMALGMGVAETDRTGPKPVSSAALQSEGYFRRKILFFEKKRRNI